MPLLYLVQSVEGRVTQDGLREVGELLGITTAEVEAVASFYTMLRLRADRDARGLGVHEPVVRAARGERRVRGRARTAAEIEHGEETSADGMVTVHEEECLGACDAAPVVQVDFANHDRVTPERMRRARRGAARRRGSRAVAGRAPKDFRDASRILAGRRGGA